MKELTDYSFSGRLRLSMLIVAATALIYVPAGCRSPRGRALSISDTRSDATTDSGLISQARHVDSARNAARIETLIRPVESQSSGPWSRLFSPFKSRKKRYPLPLTKTESGVHLPREASIDDF